MKKNLVIALWFTLVTTVIFGILYPLAVTGLAQVLFPSKANGQLVERNGKIVGSRIIGQSFTGPGYFHSRLSSAGTGYDATSSSGSNLGPTNKTLLDRVKGDVAKAAAENSVRSRSHRPGYFLRLRTRPAHFAGCGRISDSPRGQRTKDQRGGPARAGSEIHCSSANSEFWESLALMCWN